MSEQKKYSLGWHQESGYFDKHVSHKEGYVIWLPLMSVSKQQGALRVLPNSSQEGPIPHLTKYLDKENKKNLRKDIPAEITNKYLKNQKIVEVQKGDAAFFHFNTIHSSGQNIDPQYVSALFNLVSHFLTI